MGEIFQSISDKGWLRAWMTTAESPSRMNLWKFREQAKEMVNCAAKASPTFVEQGELIREDKESKDLKFMAIHHRDAKRIGWGND